VVRISGAVAPTTAAPVGTKREDVERERVRKKEKLFGKIKVICRFSNFYKP
jgi:hypothetical protein